MRKETLLTLKITPITLSQAKDFITKHHSHHKPPISWRFGCGVVNDQCELCGVATAGRPVFRLLDDGNTLEITRCCTDQTPNAASMLYNSIRRAAKALGFSRLITYTLESESGTSLKAAGWTPTSTSRGGSWSRNSRKRNDKHPTTPKTRWEAKL